MASLGNKIADFNKDIHSVVTYFRAFGEDPGNLFPQVFTTYDDCSSDIWTFYVLHQDAEKSVQQWHTGFGFKVSHLEVRSKLQRSQRQIQVQGKSRVDDPVLALKA